MHSSPLFYLSSSSSECCVCNSVVSSEDSCPDDKLSSKLGKLWRDQALVSLQCTSFEKMLANPRVPACLFALSLDHSALTLLPLVSARCSTGHQQGHSSLLSHGLTGCLAVILSYCSLSVWSAGHGRHRNKLQSFLAAGFWQVLLNMCWGCFKRISTFAKAS